MRQFLKCCVSLLLGGLMGIACGSDPDLRVAEDKMSLTCAFYGGSGVENVCAVDPSGTSYNVFLEELTTVPGGGTLGVFFYFHSSNIPDAANLSLEGKDASVKVYAAPLWIEDENCCPEDDEKNRIAVKADLTKNGRLHIETLEKLERFTQMVVVLDYRRLFPGRTLLWDAQNGQIGAAAFYVRFYVK